MTPEIVVSLLAVAGFGLALWWCRVAAAVDTAVSSSTTGLLAMLDRELDDLAKERALRRAGLDLIVSGFHLLWRFGVALTAAAAPILLADAVGLVRGDEVMKLMLRWDFIVVVSAVAVVATVLVRRWRPTTAGPGASGTPYSTADQFLHAVAFASPRVLRAASRIEDRLLSESADTPSAPPVFVTSLARGGTTALLNALHDVPGIATHSYRDMPFLTAPTLWNRLAGGGLRRVERRERAHGDGLEIDLDSPEAFEEVVWRMFWPEKYAASAIMPWQPGDRRDDAERFLREHMGKVIHARRVQARDRAAAPTRYCSKNNTNIARLDYLAEAFPGCRIVVPIRRPGSHAGSLLRQHHNFQARQTEDDFVRRYMRDIGHFEFGLIHKPIAFPGFDPERHDPRTPDYWLDYWIHAFREVLRHRDRCVLVTQDDLRATPQETMTNLCEELGLAAATLRFDPYFRASPDHPQTELFDSRLHDEAMDLYRKLETLALATGIRPVRP